jgi:hypothetical protein
MLAGVHDPHRTNVTRTDICHGQSRPTLRAQPTPQQWIDRIKFG